MMEAEKYSHEDDLTAADTSMISSTSPYQPTTEPVSNRKVVFGGFILHMEYAKSITGILKVVQLIFSIIVASCVGSAPYCYEACGGVHYLNFVSISCIVFTLILLVVFAFGLQEKLSFINWPLTDLINCVFYSVMFLISSFVMALNAPLPVYQAAAVFGFLTTILFIVSSWLAFQAFRQYQARRRTMISHIQNAGGTVVEIQ
ncbi:CKLF-like MARVEL transmembrane domain-containing protein 4 [Ciona intestinalis]